MSDGRIVRHAVRRSCLHGAILPTFTPRPNRQVPASSTSQCNASRNWMVNSVLLKSSESDVAATRPLRSVASAVEQVNFRTVSDSQSHPEHTFNKPP